MSNPFRHAVSTAARCFDFQGRTGRKEAFGYVVLSQFPVAISGLATSCLADAALARVIVLGVLVVVTAPLFALTVRRFHDMGHSGWWGLPFLTLVARMLLLDGIGLAAGWSVRAAIESVAGHVDWLLTLPATAAFVAFVVWPSARTHGRNETTGVNTSTPVA